MRIDPSSVYKKYDVQSTKKPTGEKTVKAGSLKEGQVLKGEIVDASQSKVTIKLESGQVMDAKLTGNNAYSIGDQVSFVVEENAGDQVLITALLEGEDQGVEQLKTILSEAGLPKTEENIALVKSLVENNMPIDQEHLKSMSRLVSKFPDLPLDRLVFLTKHQLPVNENNLQQLQMLENNEQPLMKAMASLVDDLSRSFTTAVASGQTIDGSSVAQTEATIMSLVAEGPEVLAFQKNINQLLEEVTQITNDQVDTSKDGLLTLTTKAMATVISPEVTGVATPTETTEITAATATPETVTPATPETMAAIATPALAEQINDLPKDPMAFGQNLMASDLRQGAVMLSEALTSTSASENLTTTQKAVIESLPSFEEMTTTHIVELFDNKLLTSEQLRDFLVMVKGGSSYQALAKHMMLSDVKVVEEGHVKDYFKDLQGKAEAILEKAALLPEGVEVSKGASEVKASLEFMNGLQQDYNFMHLPMFVNDQLLNSEFYVMNNGKNLKDDQQAVTALLRLDLLNLGHTDIYVKKVDKNIDVAFYMADEQQMPAVREEVFKLHNLLKTKGFNVLSATVQPIEKSFDMIHDFFEKDNTTSDTKRFSFDMRA